jgi:hypothetical protein
MHAREPSFDFSNEDILSERGIGSPVKAVGSYLPKETVSRVKVFPGKHMNNPSQKIVL